MKLKDKDLNSRGLLPFKCDLKVFRIIVFAIFVVFSPNVSNAKEISVESPRIFVSAAKFGKEWEVTIFNSSEKEIHGVLVDGIPKDLGIDFWEDDGTWKGLRIFGPGAKVNADGFTSDMYSISPGKSYAFKFSPEKAWTENAEVLKKWEKLRDSGYFRCRVLIKSFSSPMYSLHYKNGQIDGAHLQL